MLWGSNIWATTLLCHNLSGPWPIHLLPFHLNAYHRNYLCMRCIDVAMHHEMTFLFCEHLSGVALKEMCHCSLDNKVALCTKTNPPRPLYPPEDTFTQWEAEGNKERERHWQTEGREKLRETNIEWERETCAHLCSSVSVYCFHTLLVAIWLSIFGLP